MKSLLLLLIFAIISNQFFPVMNGMDGAHFIYYQDDSHINEWYEWWYFNAKNDDMAVLLYFFTFGDLRNPFKSAAGIFAAFFDEENGIEGIYYNPFNYSLAYEKCDIGMGRNYVYEKDRKYYACFNSSFFTIYMEMESHGKAFGGNKTMLDEWQWMAWYVAVPYGKAYIKVKKGGKSIEFTGDAYHDHNWGIGKIGKIKWDWGEFSSENFSVIYGIADGVGGMYFVNETMVSFHKINISYEKWFFKNGFLKPSLIHIKSKDGIDMHVRLQKCYIIGGKKFGKPYLFGRISGRYFGKEIDATGFYEHHGFR